MKLKIWIAGLVAAVLPAWNTGCSVQRSEAGITVPPVALLTPDTLSNVRVQTLLQIPERTLSRRSRMILRPLLMQGDYPAEPLPIRVFDAPIQCRKMARRLCFDHRPDTLASAVRPVNPARRIEIPYAATVEVPANGDGGRIVALLSIHACDRCRKVDTIELARIFDPSSLFSDATLLLADIEPHFVVRPKVGRGHDEARYNRGLLLARSNRHEEALALLKEFGTADAALAALAVGRTGQAADIMARCADTTARGEYVRALVAARQGDIPSLRAHLSRAVREPLLARRARIEPDFAAYAELPDPVVPIRSDSEYEAHR